MEVTYNWRVVFSVEKKVDFETSSLFSHIFIRNLLMRGSNINEDTMIW